MLDRDEKFLYLVADAEVKKEQITLEKLVEKAIEGGVNIVQYRDKVNDSRRFYEQALRLKDVCHFYSVPLIINDRVDIALAIKADGVHVGQDDLPLGVVRTLAKDMIVGYSVKTTEQALWGQQHGADYLGAGTVFYTSSKKDAGNAIGLEGLRKIVETVNIPVIAIGGINQSNARDCMLTGINGIAVISAITLAQDPYKAAKELAGIVIRDGQPNGM